jgi:hypothetical protein
MTETTITVQCEYFALCVRDAAGVVAHPVLTWVPTCERCAARFGLEVVEADFYAVA